jgi:hypothetical protein
MRIQCPNCSSYEVVRIVYGYPGDELIEHAQKGEVVLGGCFIEPDNPTHKCIKCNLGFKK